LLTWISVIHWRLLVAQWELCPSTPPLPIYLRHVIAFLSKLSRIEKREEKVNWKISMWLLPVLKWRVSGGKRDLNAYTKKGNMKNKLLFQNTYLDTSLSIPIFTWRSWMPRNMPDISDILSQYATMVRQTPFRCHREIF
jgi:hypothetical protein